MESDPQANLLAALRELGVAVYDRASDVGARGFPETLRLPCGRVLHLEVPTPGSVGSLDPKEVGVAVLDHVGFIVRTWGLADQVPVLQQGGTLLETELATLLEAAFRGTPGVLYLDGYRYYASGIDAETEPFYAFLMVTNASEERQVKRLADKSARAAQTLARIGRALSANQTVEQLCNSAVNEIAAASDLAAVLLWLRDGDDARMTLRSNLGANRKLTSALKTLDLRDGLQSVAEIAASTNTAFFLRHVSENMLTAELESKFCYLAPGGLTVLPLHVGGSTLGLLELVGREGDPFFAEDQDLFGTVAEHLALAVNGAMLFEDAQRLATQDPVTGVANHRAMTEYLHRRHSEASRAGDPMAVLMVDVDHFRSFNEEEGHDAGDEVLRLVAGTITKCIRQYDLVARYGGEEFTVVMPGADATIAHHVAERVRQRIQDQSYRTRAGRERHVTVSVGLALYPENASDAESLLRAADAALFRAKRSGRNRVVSFENHIDDASEPEPEVDGLARWIAPEDRQASDELVRRLHPVIEQLVGPLRLSRSQARMLNGLVRVWPSYLRARDTGRPFTVEEMEASEDLRPLMPSLVAAGERHDGSGPLRMPGHLIPLLAQVLGVLLCLAERKPLDDVGRFDPEILVALALIEEAA